jgi:hypothetical protein
MEMRRVSNKLAAKPQAEVLSAQDGNRCVICFQFIIGCGQLMLAGFAEAFTTNSSSHPESGDYHPFYS